MGYSIAPKSVGEAPEVYSYGGWSETSYFELSIARTVALPDTDTIDTRVSHGGLPPDTPLALSTSNSTATWEGILIGMDTAAAEPIPVTGDAAISVNLGTLAGTASFDRLTTHPDGETSPFRLTNLSYDINFQGNYFGDRNGLVKGGVFGTDHAEATGVVNDPARSFMGAFGGTRAE